MRLGAATITVTSTDDGVAAATDVTVEGTTLSITAGGGQANAVPEEKSGPGQQQSSATDSTASTTPSPKGINAGVSFTQDSGTVTINAADEGAQAAFVNVSGGALRIASGDDGINTSNGDHTIGGYGEVDSESNDGSVLTISGGEVQVSNANSDGLDSNGSAHVTGGTVLVSGSAGSMDGAVDANGDTTFIGGSVSTAIATGDTVTVTDSSGTARTATAAFSASSFTVLGLTEGTTYTVSTTSGGSTSLAAAALSTGGGPGGGQGGMPGPGGAPGGPGDGQAPGNAPAAPGSGS